MFPSSPFLCVNSLAMGHPTRIHHISRFACWPTSLIWLSLVAFRIFVDNHWQLCYSFCSFKSPLLMKLSSFLRESILNTPLWIQCLTWESGFLSKSRRIFCPHQHLLQILIWLVVSTFWKIWARQLGWWHSQLNGKSIQIPWFQTTNQIYSTISNHH